MPPHGRSEHADTEHGVRNLYALVLGREPIPDELAEQGASPGLETVFSTLLASWEFQVGTAEPALDGALAPVGDEPAPEQLRIWSEARFGLPPAPGVSRLALLARVLERSASAAWLQRVDAPWSPMGLAAVLRGARDPAAHACAETVRSLLQATARGLEILGVCGLSAGDGVGELRLESGPRWIVFRPAPGLETADYCRIDFGLIRDGGDGTDTLHLDLGDGFHEQQALALRPRGRTRFAAFLAEPSTVKALRWELGRDADEAKLTVLAARPLTRAQIEHQILSVAGEPGLDWLAGERLPTVRPGAREPLRLRLSRVLTRELGGHDAGQGRDYTHWLADNEATDEAAAEPWRQQLAALERRPAITLLMIVRASDLGRLRESIRSLDDQVYPDWTLLLVPSGQGGSAVRRTLERLSRGRSRIVVAPADASGATALALNAGLALASGEWIAVMGPGDQLRPDALLAFAERMGSHDPRVLYADHDLLDPDGVRSRPAFKPDYSPETLLGHDYMDRPTLWRSADVRAVGGWRAQHAGAEEYDLALRLLAHIGSGVVSHIPRVLYHRCEPARGDPAWTGVHAVREHLARLGRRFEVEPLSLTSGQRVRPCMPRPPPLVSLIMPTRDRARLLQLSVQSILDRTTYPNFELLIVDNGSVDDATHALFETWRSDPRIHVLSRPGPFNFSALNNAAAAHCAGEVVGLVNNDVEVISPDWIEQLAAWALQPNIGCVGAKLYYPDGRVQHGGVILGIGGVAAHSHKYHPGDSIGYGARLAVTHNISAVTAACLFVRRSIYQGLGGLDEALAVAFNDVDFCLKVEAAGWRNLLVPSAELYHHESATRGQDDTSEKLDRFKAEIALMKARWGERLRLDRYYSPNLSQVHENFDFNWRPRLSRRSSGSGPSAATPAEVDLPRVE